MVCFDKTGTLTRNRMTVTAVNAGKASLELSDSTPKAGFWKGLGKDPDVSWLVQLTALCNETPLVSPGRGQTPQGSSTEKALLLLAEQCGLNVAGLRRSHPILHVQHRSEKHPFMVTVHPWEGGMELTAVKGSPLDVLERCAYRRMDGKEVPLSDEERNRIENENYFLSGKGLRVLGAAYRWGRVGFVEHLSDQDWGLVWAGLVGFSDPLREGTRELIRTLHRAGIKTAVITGDQSLTAGHVGEALKVAGEEPLRILDSMSFRDLDAAAMRNIVTRTHVFARLNPTQKLQVIQAYQSSGIGVVMVGDGINDVLALKVADVGIAMGRDGTDLARNSADLVLEDDDLRKVALAIAAGRGFYENIAKSVRFLVTANQVDLASELISQGAALGSGISPWQSVWTNLACLSLASEPSHAGRLTSMPPERHDGLLGAFESRRSAQETAKLMGAAGPAALYGLARYGAAPGAAGLFFRSVSINQLLYALACREGSRDTAAPRAAGPLLRLTLWGSVGGYFALTLFRGWGGILDALALAAGALLSGALTREGE